MSLSEKLSCGHDRSCSYFHPALRGGARWRCSECDKIKFANAVSEEPQKVTPAKETQVRPAFSMEMLQVGLKWGMIIGLVCGFCIGLSLGTILGRFH